MKLQVTYAMLDSIFTKQFECDSYEFADGYIKFYKTVTSMSDYGRKHEFIVAAFKDANFEKIL